jgi:hypothetical protein
MRQSPDARLDFMEPTFSESLRLGWLLLWRAVGSFLVIMLAANLLLLALVPELPRTVPSIWAAFLPLVTATVLSLIWIMPMVVRAMLQKRFRGFRLQLIHEGIDVHADKRRGV